jgi:O-antigen/teichoic acid export membrane protein
MNGAATREGVVVRIAERLGLGAVVRRIAANAGWMGGEWVLRLFVGLPMTVWMTRYLGPGGFGDLSFALALVGIVTPLSALGLDRIAVRELVAKPGERDAILGTVLALRGAAAFVLYAITLGVTLLLRPGDSSMQLLVAICAGVVFFRSFDVVDLLFQADTANRLPVVYRSVAFGAATGLRAVCILLGLPVFAFAWAALVESAMSAVANGVALVRAGRVWRTWRASRQIAAVFLRDGWPVAVASAFILIYTRVDQVMLGQMTGSKELGVYAVAVRLIEATYFIPTVLVAAAFPSVMEARAEGEAALEARLMRLYRALALSSYAIAAGLTVVVWWAIPFLFGEAYRAAAPAAAVLAWSIPFTALGVARGAYLTAMNWMKPYLFTVVLGCVANVALNWIWIPRWGAVGASLASVVSYWIAAHGSCFLYRPLWRTGGMLTRALLRPGIAR